MFQQIANILVIGSVYALTALGFSLYFGVVNLVNFAHGDLCMLAAFLFLLVLSALGMSLGMVGFSAFLGVTLAAVLLCMLIGMLSERFLFRPVRYKSPLQALIISLAFSVCLREAVLHFYPDGGNPQPFPDPFHGKVFSFGDVNLSAIQVVSVGVCGLLAFVFYRIVLQTSFGRSMRALAQDSEAAVMIGLPVNRIIRWSFALGAGFAAVAGVLTGAMYGSIKFDMGLSLGLKGFVAATVGGLGNPNGALAGGFLLASLETAVVALLPGGSGYRDIVSYALLITALAFRPQGLLGKQPLHT